MAKLPSGTVTFLFTDIEGSTRLWEEHPDAMRDARVRHSEILREAVESHGGRVIKDTGDGGQVVVSHATQALVIDALPAGVELVDLGEHRLRDLLRPEHVFQISALGAGMSFPPLRSLNAFPGNLPMQLTSFVGRDDDLTGVAKVLEESRLVTLTGVGGVGKTRLAVQVAAEILPRFADGVWLCELAAANDADLLVQVIVAALGVQPRPGRSLTESVCDFLSGKQALIVLDNCEHLLDASAGTVEAILRAAPGVRVLATSREALAVAGEQVWPVRSLGVASEPGVEAVVACEAGRLFWERAGAARPSFVVDATNATAVAEICRRLDGLPLAVELAAARVTSMSPREIAGLLDERFRLLTGGRRRVERHHTLQATVEWSYSLLPERDRTIFDRLGVFAGTFGADAAAAVAGGDELAAWDVRDALDDLAAKSMVVLDEGFDAGTRFRLLETLRQYALDRLDGTGQTEHYRRRHAEHYAAFAEAAGPALTGPDEVTWVGRFEAELDNLRTAVAWALDVGNPAEAELGIRIIAALIDQQDSRPSTGVGEWAEAALERAEASTPGRRTAVLAATAWKAIQGGDLDLARSRASEALTGGLSFGTPSPHWAHMALAGADALAGRVQAALQTVAAGHRALDVIGAHAHGHLMLETMGVTARVFGRAARGRPHPRRGEPRRRPRVRKPEHTQSGTRLFREHPSTRRD